MRYTEADAAERLSVLSDADVRTLAAQLYADLLNRHAEAAEDAAEVKRRILSGLGKTRSVTHGNVTVDVSTPAGEMRLSPDQVSEIVRKIQERLIQQSRRTRPHGFS